MSKAAQEHDEVAATQQPTERLGDVLVLGLGATGAAVASYLADLGEPRVTSVTLYGGASSQAGPRSQALEERGVQVVLGTEQVEGSYDLCVASPGISEFSDFFQAGREHALHIIGEPELAWRESPERWVAITGSNGKTTTTTLTRELLQAGGLPAIAVGNIGTLAIGEVATRAQGEWFVAELSSFQLAYAQDLHPQVACLLNITPDHLEWHKTMERYAAAKERIFKNLAGDDLAIVYDGDEWCRAIIGRLEQRGVRVCHLDVEGDPGTPEAAFPRKGQLVVRLRGVEHELLKIDDLAIKGIHNVENALAASTIALAVGVEDAAIAQGLAAFRPLEHRIEPCGEAAGVRFINDSKATNTDAVEKALTAFPAGSIRLLLGGHDKGTDLESLAEAVNRRCKLAVCYGAAGGRIARALAAAPNAGGCEIVREPHMREAFARAVRDAQAGDVVLLSPACSSFDEFHNMEERGRVFKGLAAGWVADHA